MPRATVAWYDRRNTKAGYHVCRNCPCSDIDDNDIVIAKEEDVPPRIKICPECARKRRKMGFRRCREITIDTT